MHVSLEDVAAHGAVRAPGLRPRHVRIVAPAHEPQLAFRDSGVPVVGRIRGRFLKLFKWHRQLVKVIQRVVLGLDIELDIERVRAVQWSWSQRHM